MNLLSSISPCMSSTKQNKTSPPEITIKNRDLIAAVLQVEAQLIALTPQEFPYPDLQWPQGHELDYKPTQPVDVIELKCKTPLEADLAGSI